MIGLGTTLKSCEAPYHRMVVISDPEKNGGMVVLVRVTTDDGRWPDEDCILDPADWVELKHRSTVAYSTCKFDHAGPALEKAVEAGKFTLISSPPVATLRKIIAAARTAEGMPAGAKKWLAEV